MEEYAGLIKAVYFVAFGIVASYYWYWGENQETVTDPVDETGWVPDGELSKSATGDE